MTAATLGASTGGQHVEREYVTHTLTNSGHDASEDGTGRGPPIVAFQPEASASQSMNPSAISPSLGTTKQVGALTTSGVRRLTVTECCRLQGFPDDWFGAPNEPPDAPKYAALGDAVTVNVAEWIGRRIIEANPNSAPSTRG